MVRLCCFNTSRNKRSPEGSSPRLNRGVSFYKDVADALGSTKTDDGGHTKVTILFPTSCTGQLDNNYIFVESNDYDFFLTPTCIFFLYPTFIFFSTIVFFSLWTLVFFFGHFFPPLKERRKGRGFIPFVAAAAIDVWHDERCQGRIGVWVQRYWPFDPSIEQPARTWSRCCTCWWYSWCNLKYWSNDTNTCSDHLGSWSDPSNFFFILFFDV